MKGKKEKVIFWIPKQQITKITNAALESLLKLTSLKVIQLEDTSITDEGLKILYKIPIPELEIRGIKETKVTSEGIEKLKKHF